MKKIFALLTSGVFLLIFTGTCAAQGSIEERLNKLEENMKKNEAYPGHSHDDKHISHGEGNEPTVTFGGISLGFGSTVILQGTSGNSTVEEGPHGSYSTDIELTAPVGNGTAFALVESGDGAGVLDLGVNGDANDADNAFELTEMWYEHAVLSGMVTYTMGLLDLSNYFDGNEVANDETFQFLGDAFINSTVIDFGEGPGFRLTVSPNDLIDATVAWQEKGDDDARWDNIFGEAFYMAQVDVKPQIAGLQGNYRLYYWSDGGDHAKFGDATCTTCEHETGFGVSIDQQILDPLTIFVRFATRDEDVEQWQTALSAGFGLSGAFWGRGDDTLGFAYGMTQLSGKYKTNVGNAAGISSDQNHLEVYYSFAFNDNFVMTADLQNVSNPGGVKGADSVLVYGLRTQISF